MIVQANGLKWELENMWSIDFVSELIDVSYKYPERGHRTLEATGRVLVQVDAAGLQLAWVCQKADIEQTMERVALVKATSVRWGYTFDPEW